MYVPQIAECYERTTIGSFSEETGENVCFYQMLIAGKYYIGIVRGNIHGDDFFIFRKNDISQICSNLEQLTKCLYHVAKSYTPETISYDNNACEIIVDVNNKKVELIKTDKHLNPYKTKKYKIEINKAEDYINMLRKADGKPEISIRSLTPIAVNSPKKPNPKPTPKPNPKTAFFKNLHPIPHSVNGLEIFTVGYKSIIVKCNSWRCNACHTIVDIAGEVDVCYKDGRIETVAFPAAYCVECNAYFILQKTFDKLKQNGARILCAIITEQQFNNGVGTGFNGLNEQSILKMWGYNVSQAEGLSDEQRRAVLETVVDNHILSKTEVLNYLDFFVSQHPAPMYANARNKWRADRNYICSYRLGSAKRIRVGLIKVKRYCHK